MKFTERTFSFILTFNIFLISFLVRTYNIEKGNFVVWDESHFGKYSQRYLTRTFYFDVHPPLGKMMTALTGWIYNQDLNFDFESASIYPEKMDYVGMRRVHAFIGSFIPVFAELIFKELGYGYNRFFFALFFVFENGFIGISRLILLDSHLLFFTSAVIYAVTRLFCRPKNEMSNLIILGILIGCVMSVKWIGFLTMGTVGLYIIYELYMFLFDSGIIVFLRKFTARFLTLLLLPLTLYISFFILHFYIVNKTSIDVTYMSSLFSMTLQDSKETAHKYVDFGSVITLKSNDNKSGHLHSHAHFYPDSTAHQVTTYFHKDANNEWAFQKVTINENINDFLSTGDEIVLLHIPTKRYLNLSSSTGTFDKNTMRADCTGDDIRESNIFIVEVVNDLIKKESKVKTITTDLRLRAKGTGLYLRYTDSKYPNWGYNQGEVVFSTKKDRSSLWNIEKNALREDTPNNPEYGELKTPPFFFIFRFIKELNIQMFKVNGSFEQEEDEETPMIVSYPYEWFFLRRGLRMVNWKTDRFKFYMFGNPLLWYGSCISVFLAPILLIIKVIKNKRAGCSLIGLKKDFFEVFLFSGGWLIHYLPFFYIGRVLYFHHYYPALFFALLAMGYVFKNINIKYVYVFTSLAIIIYALYAPLTYGARDMTKLDSLKMFKSWNFSDGILNS